MRTSPYKERSSKSLPLASTKNSSSDDSSTPALPRVYETVKPQHLGRSGDGGFVQCLLLRDVTSGPRERYSLSFQLPSHGGNGKATVVPAMVAQKENSIGGHYNLFDLSRAGPEAALTKKAGHFVGKLRQDVKGGSTRRKSGLAIFAAKSMSETAATSTVSYTLLNANKDKDKLAVYIYDAPGLVTQWREGQPPRKLRAILASGQSNCGDTTVIPDDWTKRQEAVVELKTKEPFFDVGQYRLNFRGRVTVPSVKNFQLEDDEGKVLLQFGRVSDHKFHLDFCHPFCPATAFAAVLTQFDI